MNQNITCKTVQELEEFLREHYHAEQIEPVEYLLYNARQQVLNLFYPEQMQQISEQVGFSPEADEEISALFDCMTETFDRETAKSCYVQYRFEQTAPEGAQAVFYITVERKIPDLSFRSLNGRQTAWSRNFQTSLKRTTGILIELCGRLCCIREYLSRTSVEIPPNMNVIRLQRNFGTAFVKMACRQYQKKECFLALLFYRTETLILLKIDFKKIKVYNKIRG